MRLLDYQDFISSLLTLDSLKLNKRRFLDLLSVISLLYKKENFY